MRAATALVTITLSVLVAALGAAAFVWSGWYDIAANVQHTQPVYTLLERTMQRSVKRRADAIVPPALDAPALLARGATCYVDKCVQCHGGPGVAQSEIGRSMQPLPGPLVDVNQRWRPQDLYWITRNGIKMSGMPAWQHRLSEDDMWALVAFMKHLPKLTASEFRGLAAVGTAGACARSDGLTAQRSASIVRGRAALTQYACNACHSVPGITGSEVHVGPPLGGMAQRGLIAGAVPNTEAQMVRWIRDPRSIDPQTTMPAMQVNEQDARDIAAFLATLK
jgi:cytochrome c1